MLHWWHWIAFFAPPEVWCSIMESVVGPSLKNKQLLDCKQLLVDTNLVLKIFHRIFGHSFYWEWLPSPVTSQSNGFPANAFPGLWLPSPVTSQSMPLTAQPEPQTVPSNWQVTAHSTFPRFQNLLQWSVGEPNEPFVRWSLGSIFLSIHLHNN